MSTIHTQMKGNVLVIKVQGAFNLRAKNMIESRLRPETNTLRIDLKESKFIDSEGVIFLHRWQTAGNKLQLLHPPDLFVEILEILELDDRWDLDEIIIKLI